LRSHANILVHPAFNPIKTMGEVLLLYQLRAIIRTYVHGRNERKRETHMFLIHTA